MWGVNGLSWSAVQKRRRVVVYFRLKQHSSRLKTVWPTAQWCRQLSEEATISIWSSNSPHTAALYRPKPGMSAIATYQATHTITLPPPVNIPHTNPSRYTPIIHTNQLYAAAGSLRHATCRPFHCCWFTTVTIGKDHSKQSDRLPYCYKFGPLDPLPCPLGHNIHFAITTAWQFERTKLCVYKWLYL